MGSFGRATAISRVFLPKIGFPPGPVLLLAEKYCNMSQGRVADSKTKLEEWCSGNSAVNPPTASTNKCNLAT